jgi:hypothetical protein
MSEDRHLEVTGAAGPAWSAGPVARYRSDVEPEARVHVAPLGQPDGDAPPRHEPVPRDGPSGPEAEVSFGATGRSTRLIRLKVALGLAVAAAVALAGVLYFTQRLSEEELRATEAIAAYTAAWNAHDVGAVRAAMYHSGTFAPSDNIANNSMFTATVGPELDKVLRALFDANVRLSTEGRVMIADNDPARASVPQRFRYTVYGLRVVEDGISHFTLIPDGGRLKVYQHVWWRPRVPESPSMLWAI